MVNVDIFGQFLKDLESHGRSAYWAKLVDSVGEYLRPLTVEAQRQGMDDIWSFLDLPIRPPVTLPMVDAEPLTDDTVMEIAPCLLVTKHPIQHDYY